MFVCLYVRVSEEPTGCCCHQENAKKKKMCEYEKYWDRLGSLMVYIALLWLPFI